MRARYVLTLLALALMAAAPAAPGTLDPKTIKETVFPNGLRLVVKEAHGADLVSIQVWIRAGGFLEDDNTIGYAHAIEHLVFKGTEDRGPGSIDQEIEDLGGELNALTEKDWTMYGTTVASPHAMKVISVMGDALRNAKLRVEDLKLEKRALMEEIAQVGGNPEQLAMAVLFRLSFQRHPYGRDARGAPPIIQNMTVEGLRAYFQKYYVPSNMTVIVVGDVNPAVVERQVRMAFVAEAAGPKKEPFQLSPPETACEKPRREVVDAPFSAGYVGMSFPAPAVTDQPDVYAMDLLLTILEHGGMGRLPNALRGKASAVSATFQTRRQAGLLALLVQTSPGSLEAVEKTLRDEVQRLSDSPPTAEELSFAKRQLAGSYALENETFNGQGGSLGFYSAVNQWQFATTYLDRVQQVTPEQLLATIKKYVNPARSCTLVFRPRMGAPAAPPGRSAAGFTTETRRHGENPIRQGASWR